MFIGTPCTFFTIQFLHEGTVDVSEPSFKDIYRRFTTVSLKSLSDYIDERNILVFYLKIEYFRCGFSVIVTLPLLKLEQYISHCHSDKSLKSGHATSFIKAGSLKLEFGV